MSILDLFKPKWKHSDPDKRREAIKIISDQKILADVAKNDVDPYVGGAAVEKLTDQKILADLVAKNDEDSEPASKWFKEPLQRNGPLSSSDFDLFEIPSYSLKNWAEAVSSDPWSVHCTVVMIENLGTITHRLFDVLKQKYDVTSSDAVDIFNEYIGAACPKCFGGLTGELLQTIESSKNARGAVFLGGDPGLQRILDGMCATCSSKEYYVVWLGDRSSS